MTRRHMGKTVWAAACFLTLATSIPILSIPPAAAEDRDVEFTNAGDGARLQGTLSLPETATAEQPVCGAVLLNAAGLQDRDGTIFEQKPFKALSDALVTRGFAVLRYDDRGVGKSSGEVKTATSRTFAEDAEAAFGRMTTVPQVRRECTGFIGHSEGAILGAMVADRRKDVAFLVMLAPPSVRGDEILRSQTAAAMRSANAPYRLIKENDGYLTRLITAALDSDRDRLEREAKVIADEIDQGEAWVEGQVAFLNSDWMRAFLAYDPAPLYRRLRLPVLALFGDKDQQILSRINLEPAKAALSGNDNAEVTLVIGANHLFQKAETGSPREYQDIDHAIHGGTLDLIGDWLARSIATR